MQRLHANVSEKVLTHIDAVPDNFLFVQQDGKEEIRLIDWEYMFNCEALFGSELLEGGIINTTDFYEVLRETYKNDKVLTKFVEKCHLITPEGCVWYYGVAWEKLRNDYFA